MSQEEMQRMVQFLLQQQAQFAADLEKLSGKTDRVTDGLIGLTGIVGQLAAAQQRTDEQVRETGLQLRETDERLRTVESHLDVVIEMFERHLRDDHGPRPS